MIAGTKSGDFAQPVNTTQNCENMNQENNQNSQIKATILNCLAWVAATLIVAFSIYIFYIMARRGYESKVWLPIAQKHFAVVVGLPMAAITSLFIVLVLEYVSGKIEFEIPGIKFKGAAGQIIFWIICFLTIVSSIKLLWDLE
jgi:hypothetical protein